MGSAAGEDLEGKTVVYGVTGGIAAYKAPLVVRGLKRLGLDVRAVMTEAAAHFVTPLVLQTLTNRPVSTEMFPAGSPSNQEIDHIALAAVEEGLGSCWIGAFDQQKLAEYIGLPKEKVITVCIAIGYPDESPSARSRKKLEELVSWDRYGTHERP